MKSDGLYRVFGANGPIGFFDQFNHAKPQLLITCRGATFGAVNISEANSWITGNAMVVRPKDDRLLRDFVEFYFRGAVNLEAVTTGAAQPQITRQSLAPVFVPVPQLSEQKRIVDLLRSVQQHSHGLQSHYRAKLADLDALRQALLQKAFAGELC